jgi:hypothetical protein
MGTLDELRPLERLVCRNIIGETFRYIRVGGKKGIGWGGKIFFPQMVCFPN